MENLFYSYLHLYPGKADVILNAIAKGISDADAQRMTGKERIDEITSHTLDTLDP